MVAIFGLLGESQLVKRLLNCKNINSKPCLRFRSKTNPLALWLTCSFIESPEKGGRLPAP